MRNRIACVFVLVWLAACSSTDPRLDVRDAWARPAGAGENSAAYFIIDNRGNDDVLISASSTISKSTEIHRSFSGDDGIMRMQEQATITIPGSDAVRFEPGGLHVMFVGLNQDLIEGSQIQLQLVFESHGEVIVDVPIQTR